MNTCTNDTSRTSPGRAPRGVLAGLLLTTALVLAAAIPAHADLRLRVQAVVLDLDGTTLDGTGSVPAATAAAVQRFQACGGRVGIATGRVRAQADAAIVALHADLPVVLFNGALVETPDGRLLASWPMKTAAVARAAQAFRGVSGATGVLVQSRTHTWGVLGTATEADFARSYRLPLESQPWSTRSSAGVQEPPLKLLAFARDSAAADTLERAVRAALGRHAKVVRSGKGTVEALAPGVSKAAAIRAGLATLAERPTRLVAFGDSGNDAEMLREFSLGIAMGNCSGGAGDAAMGRIGTNDSGDLARVIADVLVGPKCW